MMSQTQCILGQVFGSYSAGLMYISRAGWVDEGIFPCAEFWSNGPIKQEWVRQILERRTTNAA